MKEISKFLKLKSHTIIIFCFYILFLFASTWFEIDYNYILYVVLVSIFLFLLANIISFTKYRSTLDDMTYWAKDPSVKSPDLVKETEFFEVINNLYKSNKENKKQFDIKMKELKDYISIWTHQIKTPLFSLDLILNDHPIDSHQAKAEVFAIEEYIDSLLSYIRLESLSTDFVFKKQSLDNLIRSSIKKYAKVFIKRKNKINFTPSNLNITTDEKWFGLILDQVLSNANKYTQDGEISIYVKDNNLIIEDTGIGIRKEDLPRVFDKSYTGYNGRIYKKSTGIGLNLVKNTAKNLSLDVDIESEVGQGTSLIINLSRVLN